MPADDFNILKSTVHRIVNEDMCMRKIRFKLLPKVPLCTVFIVTWYIANRDVATLPQQVRLRSTELLVPENQEGIQGPPFRDFGNCQRSNDEVFEGGPRGRIPGCIQRLGKTRAPVSLRG